MFILQPVIMPLMINAPFFIIFRIGLVTLVNGLLVGISIITWRLKHLSLPPSSSQLRAPGAVSVRHEWGNTLDGFALSTSLLPTAAVVGLHDWSRTQHCPVMLTLQDGLQSCDRLTWHKPRISLQSHASLELQQRFQAALRSQSSDEAWAIWVHLAFGIDHFPSPYRLATPSVLKCHPKDRENLLRLMKAQRRILAHSHRHGWSDVAFSKYDNLNQQISKQVALGRKEALKHWKESMNHTRTAAAWIRDGLTKPAIVTSDPRTMVEQGEAILNEWLPRWTQPPDEDQRNASAAILCQQMQSSELSPWMSPAPWTPHMIRSFCNSSAAGLDGLPFDAFNALRDDILNLLCQLFDAFDAGLPFPSCWASARLVCIQKPDGGTRPITILSAAYRIWGKRSAQCLASWTTWFPVHLVGGRPSGPRAADTANEISAILSEYHSNSLFLAGACLDVAKCFDSLSLHAVKDLFLAIGAPPFLFEVLHLWKNIQRHVWFGTEATGVVITSQSPRGIPQGDPLAPWCLNLVMSCWIRTLQPLETVRVFLDDRCILHPCIDELSNALHTTYHFDWSFGFATNVEKSSRFYVGSLPHARHHGAWFQLPLKVQIKYLGAVLETQTHLPMHSGSARAQQVRHQLGRVRFLPSLLMRQNFITAFLQGLYFDACLIPFRNLKAVTTAVVQTWWGPTRHLHNYMRSVAVTLGVLGPLHLLSPIIFMCYYCILALARLRQNCPRLAVHIWDRRDIHWQKSVGFTRQVHRCLQTIGCGWPDPDRLQFAHLAPVSLTSLVATGDAEASSRHNLRDILRLWWWRHHCPEFPYLEGCEQGIDRDLTLAPVRAMMHKSPWCGNDGTNGARYQRFLANALWSNDRLYHANKISSPICLRCGQVCDSVQHLLWDCCANSMILDRLRRSWVSLEQNPVHSISLPEELPPCIRLCGLIPSPLPTGFTPQHIHLLQIYFVDVLNAWGRQRSG